MSEIRSGAQDFEDEDDDDIFRAAFSSGVNGAPQSTGKVKIEGQQQQQQHQQQQREENKHQDHERSKHHKETESHCKKFSTFLQ